MEQKILDHILMESCPDPQCHSKYYYETERNLSNKQILNKRIKELKEKFLEFYE